MSKVIVAGGKIYAVCSMCGRLIRINKPIFGSLHICYEDGEGA